MVHDIKIIEGEKGLFIAMPSRKAADGEYRDIAHPINSDTRDRIPVSYTHLGTQIGENVVIDKAIIAENCSIGDNVTLGVGEEKPNKFNEKIYSFGLVTIGEEMCIRDRI